jgi:hypothetical protein
MHIHCSTSMSMAISRLMWWNADAYHKHDVSFNIKGSRYPLILANDLGGYHANYNTRKGQAIASLRGAIHVELLLHCYTPAPNPLHSFMRVDKIRTAILQYPSEKSFGLDTMHIRILKTLCQSSHFLHSLQQLFSLYAATQLTPTRWNTSEITPIPKKSDILTPSNSRPISLTPCLRRVFELWCCKLDCSPLCLYVIFIC